MTLRLLTGHHLEFLNLKGGCKGSHESINVKMPHCWKPHVAAQLCKSALSYTSDSKKLDFLQIKQ